MYICIYSNQTHDNIIKRNSKESYDYTSIFQMKTFHVKIYSHVKKQSN